jgi:hypothetical protein
MATKQELFTKVTGLTFDVEKITDLDKLAWLIPDGAMLDNPDGRKAKETKEFMALAGLSEDSKFSTVEVDYDDEEENNSSSSND